MLKNDEIGPTTAEAPLLELFIINLRKCGSRANWLLCYQPKFPNLPPNFPLRPTTPTMLSAAVPYGGVLLPRSLSAFGSPAEKGRRGNGIASTDVGWTTVHIRDWWMQGVVHFSQDAVGGFASNLRRQCLTKSDETPNYRPFMHVV